MKNILASIFVLALCEAGHTQTIKTLGYNSSNGVLVSATNVTWTNSFKFSTNTVAAQVRTNLNLGWPALTNSNAATGLFGYTQPAGQEAFVVNPPSPADTIVFTNGITVNGNFWGTYHVGEDAAITFETSPAPTRTNLGLGWSALTNSNATNFQAAVFSATNTAPTNTTNVAGWINVSVGSGTNVYKLPVYK